MVAALVGSSGDLSELQKILLEAFEEFDDAQEVGADGAEAHDHVVRGGSVRRRAPPLPGDRHAANVTETSEDPLGVSPRVPKLFAQTTHEWAQDAGDPHPGLELGTCEPSQLAPEGSGLILPTGRCVAPAASSRARSLPGAQPTSHSPGPAHGAHTRRRPTRKRGSRGSAGSRGAPLQAQR